MREGGGGGRGQVRRHRWHGGGEGSEILGSKGDDVVWLPQEQELQEVGEERFQLRVVAHVHSVVSLQLILPSNGQNVNANKSGQLAYERGYLFIYLFIEGL